MRLNVKWTRLSGHGCPVDAMSTVQFICRQWLARLIFQQLTEWTQCPVYLNNSEWMDNTPLEGGVQSTNVQFKNGWKRREPGEDEE